MFNLNKYKDSKYTKISIYVIGTVIITFFLCILISMSGGFFENLFHVIGLVLKPFIAGGIIAYLFEPVVQWVEKRLMIKAARPIAVFGTLLIIVLVIIALLFTAVAFITNQVQEINISDIGSLVGDFSVQLNDIWAKAQEWFANHDINIGKITGGVSGFISGITGAATDILFAVIFAIYFMLDSNAITGYWDRVRGIFIKPETRAKVHEVLMDADNNAFYAVFLSDGITTLKKIDVNNGTAETTAVFGGFPFIDDKLKIHHGKAYFLFANDASRKKRLYEVALE